MPKNLFSVEPEFRHGEEPSVGVLLVNLGTPAAPTPEAVRAYLRQFLWDPRVIELSRPKWWLILHLFVLTFRPRKSAELYARIWTDQGSPLLVVSRRIAEKIEAELKLAIGTPTHVALGMTYGEPSVPAALAELKAQGCHRLLVLPLFSHYSSSSTGAAFDAVMKELMTWRRIPEVRTVHRYPDEPALIRALAARVREQWGEDGEPEMLVTSYHSIPKRYFDNGDPYHCLCHKTTRLLAEELSLPEDRYLVTFQSRLGREEWLQPYTDVTLEALARSGVGSVDVICPGFRIDCLETIDEVGRENREIFLEAGGERYRFIPCLNDHPDQIALLVDLAHRNLGGWVESREERDEERVAAEATATRERAEAMMARPFAKKGSRGFLTTG